MEKTAWDIKVKIGEIKAQSARGEITPAQAVEAVKGLEILGEVK